MEILQHLVVIYPWNTVCRHQSSSINIWSCNSCNWRTNEQKMSWPNLRRLNSSTDMDELDAHNVRIIQVTYDSFYPRIWHEIAPYIQSAVLFQRTLSWRTPRSRHPSWSTAAWRRDPTSPESSSSARSRWTNSWREIALKSRTTDSGSASPVSCSSWTRYV